MRSALPLWETAYSHDRRAHRHRCSCCRRIVNAGERVLMAKTAKGPTRVCHVEPCAEVIAVSASMCREGVNTTYRALFALYARENLKARGWSDRQVERAAAEASNA